MAVSLASIGTASVGTTSPLSTPYPASIASGDLLLHLIASKFVGSAHTTPTGFDFLDSDAAGFGSEDGSDRGTVVASAFDRIADGAESGNLSTTWTGLTGGSVAMGIIARLTRSGGSGFDVVATTARWTTDNTNPISVAFDDAIDFEVDDYCLIFYGNNSDNPTNITPVSLTASGITFSSPTTQLWAKTVDGGDMGIAYVDAVVTAGSGTTAPSFSATKNTSNVGEGPLIFIRIRESSGGSPPAGIVTITDVDPGETTATPTWTIDDATGVDDYEARIDGGTPFSIGTTSPAVDAITGLTAATDYDTPGLEIRAVNSFGAGDWSTAFPFSTDNPGGGGGGIPTDLTVQDSTHGHTADNITLSTGTTLTVQDAVHAHTADEATLSTGTSLTVADALHSHAAESPTLSTGTALVVADALHDHTADNVVLDVSDAVTLTVADALHAHAADAVGLTTDTTLAVVDALHAHTADNITIEPLSGTTLTVQDATHAHTADGVALTLDLTLAVQDALHGHAADEVALDLGYVTLVVQDARHAHTADSVTLSGDVEPPAPAPTPPQGGGGQTTRRRRPSKQEIEWQEDEAFQDVLALLNRSKNQQEAEMAEVLEVIMALAAAGVLD